MSPPRRILLAVAIVAAVVLGLVLWHYLGPVAIVGGAAASAVAVGAARRTVRGERRSAGRRHVEEVREVERLQDRLDPERMPDDDDTDPGRAADAEAARWRR